MKNKTDLINNYEKHSKEITDLKKYFNDIVPSNYLVRIRYNSDRNVDMVVYEPNEDSTKRDLLFRQWDVNLDKSVEAPQNDYEKKYNGKTNSLEIVKEKLNWTDKTFNDLKSKLDNVDCIGIVSGNPTKIEYGYNLLAVLSNLIFNENLDKEQQEQNSNDCNLLFYKDNIVLAYGSAAFGDECNPEFKRYE